MRRWTDDEGAEGVLIDQRLSVTAKPSMTADDGTVIVGIDAPWIEPVQVSEEQGWIVLYALRTAPCDETREYDEKELAGVARDVERQLAEAQGRA